jgi:hypothetical protein
MGKAIGECGRNMSYSCSWPAALGDNSSQKPFVQMAADGCNTVRRPLRPFRLTVLTDIYLCNVCSCQEILRRNAAGSGAIGTTLVADGGPCRPS